MDKKVVILDVVFGLALVLGGCNNSEKNLVEKEIKTNVSVQQPLQGENILSKIATSENVKINPKEYIEINDYYTSLYTNLKKADPSSKMNQTYTGDTINILGNDQTEELNIRFNSDDNIDNKEVVVYREMIANIDKNGNLVKTEMVEKFLKDLKDTYILSNVGELKTDIKKIYKSEKTGAINLETDPKMNCFAKVYIEKNRARFVAQNKYKLVGEKYTAKYTKENLNEMEKQTSEKLLKSIKKILDEHKFEYAVNEKKHQINVEKFDKPLYYGSILNNEKKLLDYDGFDIVIYTNSDFVLSEKLLKELNKVSYNTYIQGYKLNLPKYKDIFDYTKYEITNNVPPMNIANSFSKTNLRPYTNVKVEANGYIIGFEVECKVN